MPLGATLAVIGVAGGFAASKAFGGSDQKPASSSSTSNLVDQATKTQPPSAVQDASNATDQANIAALKQRKKAAAGDTLMTPSTTPDKSGIAGTPTPASLIGSK